MKQESRELSYKGRGRGRQEEKGEEQRRLGDKQSARARGEHMHAATGSSKRVLAGVCVCVGVCADV